MNKRIAFAAMALLLGCGGSGSSKSSDITGWQYRGGADISSTANVDSTGVSALVLLGHTLYYSTNSGYVAWVDASSDATSTLKGAPSLVINAGASGPSAMAGSGTKLWAESMGHFAVIDVSATPTITEHATTIMGNVMATDGKRVVIADAAANFQVVDVASSPVVVHAKTSIGFTTTAMILEGNTLYATTPSSRAVSIIDVSNPDSPRTVSQAFVSGSHVGSGDRIPLPSGIAKKGNTLYASSIGALAVIDVSDPTRPSLLGENLGLIFGKGSGVWTLDHFIGAPQLTLLSDGRLATGSWHDGVYWNVGIWDASDVTAPKEVASLGTPLSDGISSIAVAGSQLFASNGATIAVLQP